VFLVWQGLGMGYQRECVRMEGFLAERFELMDAVEPVEGVVLGMEYRNGPVRIPMVCCLGPADVLELWRNLGDYLARKGIR